MKKPVFLIILSLSAGCASFTPQLGFQDVNEDFRQRTGNYIYWNNGSEEDKKVEQEIARLLSSEINVESATQVALLNNRGLQATFQDLGLAQADLVDAGLIANPVLSGDIRFFSEGTGFELSIVENFIRILEIPLRKKITESQFEEAKLRVVGEALKLSFNVRSAFYKYQSAEQMLELSGTALLALEASKDLAERLYRAGNINDLALAQEQANYEALRIDVTADEALVVQAREALNALLGLTNDQLNWKSHGRLTEPPALDQSGNQIEAQALANSVELATERQRLVTLGHLLGISEKFRMLEDTEAGLSAAKEAGGKWGFGPAFNIPLPFFSQGQAKVFRANAELSRAYDLYADTAVKVRSAVRAVLGQLKVADARQSYYRKTLLPLQEKIVAESQKHYNAMLISAFELLEAKHKQIDAGKSYLSSLKDYWILRTELESLINGKLPE